jgi:hypothetical protein
MTDKDDNWFPDAAVVIRQPMVVLDLETSKRIIERTQQLVRMQNDRASLIKELRMYAGEEEDVTLTAAELRLLLSGLP